MKELLLENGFTKVGDKYIYDFSDFEVLEFLPVDHITPDGRTVLKTSNLRLYNPFDGKDWASIPYELYFVSIAEFYKLLELMGYGGLNRLLNEQTQTS